MKPRHVLAATAVVLILLVGRLFFGSAEEKIRGALEEMAALASRDGDEQPLAAAQRALSIASWFTLDCQAADDVEGRVVRGRDAVARAVGQVREGFRSVEARVEHVEIVLHGEDAADVTAVLRLEGMGDLVAELDGARAAMNWTRVDGHWRIASVMVSTKKR